jgi:hypothetical protein
MGDLEHGEDDWMNGTQKNSIIKILEKINEEKKAGLKEEWDEDALERKKKEEEDWNDMSLIDMNNSFLMEQEKSKQKREIDEDELEIKIKRPNSEVKREVNENEVDNKTSKEKREMDENELDFTIKRNQKLLTIDEIDTESKRSGWEVSTCSSPQTSANTKEQSPYHSPHMSANVNLANDDDQEINFSRRHTSNKFRNENIDIDLGHIKSSSISVDPSHLRVGIKNIFHFLY